MVLGSAVDTTVNDQIICHHYSSLLLQNCFVAPQHNTTTKGTRLTIDHDFPAELVSAVQCSHFFTLVVMSSRTASIF